MGSSARVGWGRFLKPAFLKTLAPSADSFHPSTRAPEHGSAYIASHMLDGSAWWIYLYRDSSSRRLIGMEFSATLGTFYKDASPSHDGLQINSGEQTA